MKLEQQSQEPWQTTGATFLWLLLLVPLDIGCLYHFQPMGLAAILVLPRWIWLLPALASLALFWKCRRCMAWRTLLVSWCLFSIFFLEEILSHGRLVMPVPKVASGTARLVVLSVNCAGNGTVIEDILPYQPDLVLIQESPSREKLVQWGEQLWGEDFGISFARDCTILACGQLTESQADVFGTYALGLWRPMEGVKIHVTSLRLWPQPFRVDYWKPECWQSYAEVRRRQFTQIEQLVAQLRSKNDRTQLLIGGDFNSPAGDLSERELAELQLREAFSQAGCGWGKTITSDVPFHRIDRIWTSPGLRSVSVTAHATRHTDHRIVKCLIDVGRHSH